MLPYLVLLCLILPDITLLCLKRILPSNDYKWVMSALRSSAKYTFSSNYSQQNSALPFQTSWAMQQPVRTHARPTTNSHRILRAHQLFMVSCAWACKLRVLLPVVKVFWVSSGNSKEEFYWNAWVTSVLLHCQQWKRKPIISRAVETLFPRVPTHFKRWLLGSHGWMTEWVKTVKD